jgi:hypothetical protein
MLTYNILLGRTFSRFMGMNMKPLRRIRRWLFYWLAPSVMSGLAVYQAAQGHWPVACLWGLIAVVQVSVIRLLWRARPPIE